MKREIKETPIDKVVEIDGVKCYKLGAIDFKKQYRWIPAPLSNKLSKEIDDINSYLFDLQLLIDNTFVKLSIWRLVGSNDTSERYDDEALELCKELERLSAKTDDVLAKTAKVYKAYVDKQRSISASVNKCFNTYERLCNRKSQNIGRDSHIIVEGGDFVIGSGGMPILTNTKVMDEYKQSRVIPTNLISLDNNLGKLLDRWLFYRGVERSDDGSIAYLLNKDPQTNQDIEKDILQHLSGEPSGKKVASIYHTLCNMDAINCKEREFVRRLNKYGININYDAVTKYNDEADQDYTHFSTHLS